MVTSPGVSWTFALPRGVSFDAAGAGCLATATGRWQGRFSRLQRAMLCLLAERPRGLDELLAALAPEPGGGRDHAVACFAFLFELESRGYLSRGFVRDGRVLFSTQPHRAPDRAFPELPPADRWRLDSRAVLLPAAEGVHLEVPGCWARLLVEERSAMPWLHDLAASGHRPAGGDAHLEGGKPEPRREESGHLALVTLLAWIGCLREPGGARDRWSSPELLFHSASRRGFARRRLGKVVAQRPAGARISVATDEVVRLPPPAVSIERPFSAVLAARRSVRTYGAAPLELPRLGDLLYHAFGERGGRRPYPSGGGCYPLTAYLAVARCGGLEPGLFAYHDSHHVLSRCRCSARDLEALITGAARAAGQPTEAHLVLVLSAHFETAQAAYAQLAYSLILKEVGAVFQTVALVAAALDIASCPLGTGDSRLFSRLIGSDPRVESSVGEMLLGPLGSLPPDAPSGCDELG